MRRLAALVLVGALSGAVLAQDPPKRNEPGKAFDVNLEPKLSSEELAFILSEVSGGVYRLAEDGASIANYTPDSEFAPLLRFEDVATLIQAHAERVAALAKARLAEAERAGRGPRFSEDERRMAQHVRRGRHMFLSAEDLAVLDEAFGYRYGNVPDAAVPAPAFDGGAAPAAAAPTTSEAALPRDSARSPAAPPVAARPPPAPKDPLYERVAASVDFGGTPAEQRALRGMLAKVLETDSGRRFSADFLAVAKPGEVVIEFEDIPDSKVVDWNGTRVFTGSGGHAHTSQRPIRVHLNRNFLAIDDGQRKGASTLAHEFLGHTRQTLKARAAGVEKAVHVWDQNEPNAGAVGWTAGLELGLPATEGWMWTWLRDPAGYPQALKTNQPYYAGTFSVDELRRKRQDGTSAVPDVLAARRAAAREALAEQDGTERSWRRWQRAYDYFAAQPEFRSAPQRLEGVRRRIDGQLTGYLPSRRKHLGDIVTAMDAQIARYSTPAGNKELAGYAAAAANPLFAAIERENTWLHGRLSALTAGRDAASEAPKPPPGWISWSEFEKMVRARRSEDPRFMDGP